MPGGKPKTETDWSKKKYNLPDNYRNPYTNLSKAYQDSEQHLTLIPHPKQQAFLQSPEKIVMAVAGVQSGKTTAGSYKLINRLIECYKYKKTNHIENEGIMIWVVAPIYRLLSQPQINIKRVLTEYNLDVKTKWSAKFNGIHGLAEIYLDPAVKIRIKFVSAENPTLIVSDPVDLVWIDEFCRVPKESFDKIQNRISNRSHASIIMTSSPEGQNWAYRWYVLGRRPGEKDYDPKLSGTEPTVRAYLWYSLDCPGPSKDFIEFRKRNMDPKEFAMEYEADFTSYRGKIFSDFDLKRHTKRDLADNSYSPEVFLGIDQGINNPGAMLVCGVDREAGKVNILEEVCAADKQNDWWLLEFGRLMAKYPTIESVYIDPAARGLKDLLKYRQFQVLGNDRYIRILDGNNDVGPGLACLRNLFASNNILIDADQCPVLLDEIQSYRWDKDKEKPIKKEDHIIDACRYVCYTIFRKMYGIQSTQSKIQDYQLDAQPFQKPSLSVRHPDNKRHN